MAVVGSKRGEAISGARFPAGRVGYAVGDIHGRLDLLERMLDALEQDFRVVDAEPPTVIFLGDYVDRGPDSQGVIELLQYGRPDGFERRFLKGNHEAAMLAFLDNPVDGKAWLRHGGLETMASYDVRPLPSLGAGAEELRQAGRKLQAQMPANHRQFLEELERYVVLGDYCFAHAGVDPARRLETQTDTDLFWIRERFLRDERPLSHCIVHGHTPAEAPHIDRRRIGLDTGAYFSGVLSAARFEGDRVSIIEVR